MQEYELYVSNKLLFVSNQKKYKKYETQRIFMHQIIYFYFGFLSFPWIRRKSQYTFYKQL